jgi:hypothetical protein
LYGNKISHATLAKVEKVYDAAQQDPTTFGQIWADLNSGKISPNKAYKALQRIQTHHNETIEPQPPTTDKDDKGKEGGAQSGRTDATECEKDIVRKTTLLIPPNQTTEHERDKIKELQEELDERTREVTELKRTKEKQADIRKDDYLNLSNVAVSNTGDFEFSLLLGDIKYHLVSLYPKIGDGRKVWFSGKLDKDTGKILSIKIGRIANHNHTKHLDRQ